MQEFKTIRQPNLADLAENFFETSRRIHDIVHGEITDDGAVRDLYDIEEEQVMKEQAQVVDLLCSMRSSNPVEILIKTSVLTQLLRDDATSALTQHGRLTYSLVNDIRSFFRSNSY
jgi:hypothetical protein